MLNVFFYLSCVIYFVMSMSVDVIVFLPLFNVKTYSYYEVHV